MCVRARAHATEGGMDGERERERERASQNGAEQGGGELPAGRD